MVLEAGHSEMRVLCSVEVMYEGDFSSSKSLETSSIKFASKLS
jgi:hypothetical protein